MVCSLEPFSQEVRSLSRVYKDWIFSEGGIFGMRKPGTGRPDETDRIPAPAGWTFFHTLENRFPPVENVPDGVAKT